MIARGGDGQPVGKDRLQARFRKGYDMEGTYSRQCQGGVSERSNLGGQFG